MKKKTKKTIRPLVSVVMPVYNAEKFLDEAISSILNQTYRKFELIIVDDASTDASRRIIGKYKRRFPRKIKSIYLKKNQNNGGDRCANEGIKLARGEYIARMDADDLSFPHRLARQVEFLQNNPDIFMVGSSAQVIDHNSKKIGKKTEPRTNEEIKKSFFTFNPIIHPSVMLRAHYLNGTKFRYHIRFSANNDYYTFFKLSCQGAMFHNLSEPLIQFRIHQTNDTFNNIKKKYTNTLLSRIFMIFKYRYIPTIESVFTAIAQTAVVYLLPEKILKNIYLLNRGIITISDLKKKLELPKFKLGYNLR